MKKGIIACMISSVIIGSPLSFHLQSYSATQQSSITGKVSPSEAAETAYIIATHDTLRTDIVSGYFSLPATPGTYKLVVYARPPYRNILLGNLEVKQNRVLNIGEIILQK